MIGIRHKLSALSFGLALVMLASCAAPTGNEGADLKGRLVAANLLAGSLAEGLTSATRAGVIVLGSDRARLIGETLGAVERSLDGAGLALRSGLPQMAARQIGAAESQLGGLQPLLPGSPEPQPIGDAP